MNPDIPTIAMQLWMRSNLSPKELSKGEIIEELNMIQRLEEEITTRKNALKASYEGRTEEGCCIDR